MPTCACAYACTYACILSLHGLPAPFSGLGLDSVRVPNEAPPEYGVHVAKPRQTQLNLIKYLIKYHMLFSGLHHYHYCISDSDVDPQFAYLPTKKPASMAVRLFHFNYPLFSSSPSSWGPEPPVTFYCPGSNVQCQCPETDDS